MSLRIGQIQFRFRLRLWTRFFSKRVLTSIKVCVCVYLIIYIVGTHLLLGDKKLVSTRLTIILHQDSLLEDILCVLSKINDPVASLKPRKILISLELLDLD